MKILPIQRVLIAGKGVTVVALPIIMRQFKDAGKLPGSETVGEILDTLKIYNPIPAEEEQAYREALLQEYRAYFTKEAA